MLLALCLSSACSPRLLSPRSPLSPSAVSPPPAPLLLIDFPVPSTLLIFFSRIIVFNHRTIPFGLSSHRPALSIFRRLRSPSGRGELSLLISFVVVCFTVPLILSLSPFFPLPTNLDDFLCCSTSFSCQSPRFSVYLLPTYCTPPLPLSQSLYSTTTPSPLYSSDLPTHAFSLLNSPHLCLRPCPFSRAIFTLLISRLPAIPCSAAQPLSLLLSPLVRWSFPVEAAITLIVIAPLDSTRRFPFLISLISFSPSILG